MTQPIGLWMFAAPDLRKGSMFWDELARSVLASPYSRSLFGLSLQTRVDREQFVKRLDPLDAARDEAAWIQALDPAGSHRYDLVYPIRRACDGVERWIESAGQVEYDGDRPIRILGVLRDVTDEQLAGERLARNESHFRAFIKDAPAAVAMFDRDLRYLAASDRWRAYLRIEGDPVGRGHYEVCPDFPPSWKSVHQRCLAGAVESVEGEPFHCIEGGLRWVKWEARPWRESTGVVGGIVVGAQDIAASREAEAIATHLASLVTSSREAIISTNRDWTVSSWNAAATKLLGYSAEDILGQPITRIIPQHLLEREKWISQRVIAGEGVDDFETRRMAKDGRLIDVSLTISPIKGASGGVIGACKVIHDISARKRTENALRESEAWLRLALKGARAAVWQYNIAEAEAIWSPEVAAMHELDAKTPPTYANWLASLHPEDRPLAEGALRAALERRAPQYRAEYRVPLPSGEARWVAALGHVDFGHDGAPLRVSGINLDITERKHSELALRQSRARLNLSANAARLTYANIDFRLQTVEVAENFAQVMGYTPLAPQGAATLAGAMASLLGHVAPIDRARVAHAFQRFLAGVGSERIEYRVIGDDGFQRWIDGGWMLEFDHERRLASAFLTALDITAMVDVRDALSAAKAEAEEADQAKSKFLAAASHDLRQPVQSLTLLLAIIKRMAADAPRIVEIAGMAEGAVASLNSLLSSILDISKLDAGVVAPVIESVNLELLISQLESEYASRAAEAGLRLRVAPQALAARTDAALLGRILRNLLENALRYTSKGGIFIGLRHRGETVRIDVIDTGRGIPEDKQAEIFEEFRQLDNPARDSSQGLGLGLSIVSRLCKLLGTRVEVSSRLGRGSRFSISLPLDRLGARIARVEPEPENPGGRILVIEDNLELRRAMEVMLREWSYETVAAATGEEAVEIASRENWRFDTIVADHRLGPGLSGVAAAAEIGRRASRAIPTMIITGDTEKERIAEVHASGFSMLHKPVSASELRRYLAQAVSGR